MCTPKQISSGLIRWETTQTQCNSFSKYIRFDYIYDKPFAIFLVWPTADLRRGEKEKKVQVTLYGSALRNLEKVFEGKSSKFEMWSVKLGKIGPFSSVNITYGKTNLKVSKRYFVGAKHFNNVRFFKHLINL